MKQRKADDPFIIGIEILVIIGILLLLASIFVPVFWRLDKNSEMNFRIIGMATSFVGFASFIAWFIKWLFGITRPITVLIAVSLIIGGLILLFK